MSDAATSKTTYRVWVDRGEELNDEDLSTPQWSTDLDYLSHDEVCALAAKEIVLDPRQDLILHDVAADEWYLVEMRMQWVAWSSQATSPAALKGES